MTITAVQRLDVFPNGNPKPNQKAEVSAAHARLRDCDPRELTPEDFASIGHERRPLLALIRQNCIECQGGNAAEVHRCQCTGCVFWPYRMNTNPLRAAASEAQREAGRRNSRFLRSDPGKIPDESEEGASV